MDVTATEPEHNALNVAGDRGARILVVEDEHLVALDIQLRVERMGHRPVVTYSAEEALQLAADTKLDLVLMDIKLKGNLDGIDAARQLRALYDLPIIYLTAYADNRTLERARQTEPYGYVLKPFQERELKAAIDIALEKHEADKQRTVQQHMQRFLADASARLATTLDYGSVAVDAAALIIPRHADWCTIHLKESSDLVAPYTYTCPNGTETDGHSRPGHLIESVESTGKPELLVQIPDAASLVEALGAHHLDVLRKLGARSALCVPFIARDHVIGALLLVAGRERPRYSPTDLAFIEDFAHRLAMALDNAILYRAAERAIRMRDDVLAIVSHDLRTPLGTILLQAEKLVDNAEFSRLGVAIMRSAHRMNRLIGDLLDASAINAGQLTLDRRGHGAADIGREALDMFRSQADAHGIALVADLPEETRRVSCDRDRIVQVLSNLLANAIKFTPRGGTVTMRVEEADDGIHFEVQDTGPGIAPEQLPYLFDRFWRTQQQNKGAGLGLFISRGIIAAHGSTLLLESKLCIGSRFYFVLPEPDRDGTS